jgi:hypothetical protein
MLAKLKTFSLLGIEAIPVEVEVDVSPSGLPKTVIVGTKLADCQAARGPDQKLGTPRR